MLGVFGKFVFGSIIGKIVTSVVMVGALSFGAFKVVGFIGDAAVNRHVVKQQAIVIENQSQTYEENIDILSATEEELKDITLEVLEQERVIARLKERQRILKELKDVE